MRLSALVDLIWYNLRQKEWCGYLKSKKAKFLRHERFAETYGNRGIGRNGQDVLACDTSA